MCKPCGQNKKAEIKENLLITLANSPLPAIFRQKGTGVHLNCQLGKQPLNEKTKDEGLNCSGRKKAQEKNGKKEERKTKSFFCEFWEKIKPGKPGSKIEEKKERKLYWQRGRGITMIGKIYLKMHGSNYEQVTVQQGL